MKTRTLAQALAFATIGAAAITAHAAPISLQNAIITATYNGAATGMLGLDHGFAAEAGSNITGLDPTGTGVEFLTADYLFGIDFSADGGLTVIANGAIPTGAYSMRFDFGSSLAAPITSFTFLGSSGASGDPGLAVIDAHTISLDLGAVEWSEFGSVSAAIETAAAPVPEPSSTALLLAGLGCLALVRRARRPRP